LAVDADLTVAAVAVEGAVGGRGVVDTLAVDADLAIGAVAVEGAEDRGVILHTRGAITAEAGGAWSIACAAVIGQADIIAVAVVGALGVTVTVAGFGCGAIDTAVVEVVTVVPGGAIGAAITVRWHALACFTKLAARTITDVVAGVGWGHRRWVVIATHAAVGDADQLAVAAVAVEFAVVGVGKTDVVEADTARTTFDIVDTRTAWRNRNWGIEHKFFATGIATVFVTAFIFVVEEKEAACDKLGQQQEHA